jgi:hypothetical protein
MISMQFLVRGVATALIVAGVPSITGAAAPVAPRAPAPVAPQTPAQIQRPYTEVTLTPAVIQTFIQTYPVIRPQVETIGKKYNVAANRSAPDGGLGAYATATAASAEMNAAVAPHGYADFRAWINTTMTIMFATQWAVGGAQLDAMLNQSPRALPPGANLIPGFAQQQQQIQQGTAALAAMKPSQASIDAVRPYVPQITPLLK